MNAKIFVLVLIFKTIAASNYLIGFDCGSTLNNITTISLSAIPSCIIEKPKLETSTAYIGVLQLKDYEKIKIFQCLIEIHRRIESCSGYFNYVKPLENDEANFIKDISSETCKNIHETGISRYDINKHV